MSRFGIWLEREGYAPRTIKQYDGCIRRAERWLEAKGYPPLRQCGWDGVKAWFDSLKENHSSRRGAHNALSAYWRYLGRKWPGKLRVPKRPQMESRAIEPEELEKVLSAAKEMGPMPYAAACLGYYAGLRRSEICGLRWEDVGAEWLRVLGKGYREDRLPVHPKLREVLDALPVGGPYVLSSGRDPRRRIADGTLNLWFSAIRLATGVPITPHVLRHTGITEVNDRTQNLRSAQAFARHSDPRVTAGYTRLKAKRLQEAVASL